MKNQIKSEFRKLLTVRSTYLISILALLAVIGLSFYFEGYRLTEQNENRHPYVLADATLDITAFTMFVSVIAAILLMAHEYRYNTIYHTLTRSNSRSKVLASKIIVVAVFTAVFSASMVLITWGSILLGAAFSSNPLPLQENYYLFNLLKIVAFSEGFALAGLLLAALIRNVVATFAILFVVPNITEGLANLILKENSIYLPFSALGEIVNPAPPEDIGPFVAGDLTPIQGALVFSSYLLAGWLITWYLFLRRDAN